MQFYIIYISLLIQTPPAKLQDTPLNHTPQQFQRCLEVVNYTYIHIDIYIHIHIIIYIVFLFTIYTTLYTYYIYILHIYYIYYMFIGFSQNTSQAKASPPARCAVATASSWAPPWPWRWARCSQAGGRGAKQLTLKVCGIPRNHRKTIGKP